MRIFLRTGKALHKSALFNQDTIGGQMTHASEFSADVDLLDDAQYELAKAKKVLSEKEAEIAELKKGGVVKTKKDLDKGSNDEDVKDDVTKKADKVRSFFLGE